MKKILSILLTVAMTLSLVVPVTVFATDTATFSVTVNGETSTEIKAGDTIVCSVSVPTNADVSNFQVKTEFNTSYLTVTNIASTAPSDFSPTVTDVSGANSNEFVNVTAAKDTAISVTDPITCTITFTVNDELDAGKVTDLIKVSDDFYVKGGTADEYGEFPTLTTTWSTDTSFDATVMIPATSIDITKATTSIVIDGTETLAYTVSPTDTTDSVTWSSSSDSIAKVDSTTGLVTGVAEGSATITATTTSGKTDTCTVTVSKKTQDTFTITTTSATYGTDLTLATSGGSGDGDVTYKIVVDGNSTGSATIDGTTFKPTGVGTVEVQATKAATTAYAEATATATITIAKASLTKPTDDTTVFTYTGVAQTYTPSGYDSATMTMANDSQTSAGTSTVSVSLNDTTNYQWADGTTDAVEFSFVIAKAPLTLTGATVTSKTFDNTTSATITAVTFGGLVNNEALTLTTDYTVSSAVFADANAGTGKTVTATVALVAEGSVAKNYSLANGALSTTGPITQADAVTGIAGAKSVLSSTYDTTDTTTAYSFDLSTLTGTATNMGTLSYTVVSSEGTMISGTPTIEGTTLSFNVDPQVAGTTATITVTVSSTNYADSTATITITAINKADAGVSVIQTGTTYGTALADPVVNNTSGTGGTWTYTYTGDNYSSETKPTAAGDYTVTAEYEDADYYGSDTANFTIAQKEITISGITATDKTYDGNTAATLVYTNAVFSGIVSGDTLTVTATGVFADKNIGTSKTVTLSDLALGGTDVANYTLVSSGNQTTTTATITAVTLTDVNTSAITVTKEYDGATTAGTLTGTVSFSGKIGSEDVSITATASAYASANVTTTGAVTLTLALAGADAGNYALSSTTATIETAVITAKNVTEAQDATSINVAKGFGTFSDPDFGDVTGTLAYTDYADHAAVVTALAALAKDATLSVTYTYTANGNYTGTITGTINFTVVDIVFATVADGGVVATDSTYGATWAEVLEFTASDYSASLDGADVDGEFTLLVDNAAYTASNIPDAKMYNYTVVFNGSGYTNVVADSDTVTISNATITVTGNTVQTATYTGEDIYVTDPIASTVNNQAYTVSFDNGNTKTEVGEYSIAYTIRAANHNDATGNVTFSITKAASDIVSSLVAPASVTYGNTLTVTFTPEVLISTLSLAEDTAELVYGTTVLQTVSKASDGSYTFSYDTSDKKLSIGDNLLTINYGGSSNLNVSSTTCTVELVAKDISGETVGAIADLTYNETAQEPAVTVTGLTQGTDYTVAYTNNTNVGTATATISGIGYYTGSVTKNFTINKNNHISGTATGAAKAGATGTVSLASWSDFDGVSFGTPVVDGTTITAASIADGVLSFTVGSEAVANTTADITTTVSSTNYNDFTVTITITVSALDVPVLIMDAISKTYDGVAITSADLTGTAMVGDVEIPGTWSFTGEDAEYPTAVTDVDNSSVYGITFTPDDLTEYATNTTSVSITISQATITITADNKSTYNGYSEPTYTYTITGLVSGESMTEPTSVAGVDVDMSTNGTYVIAVSQDASASDNYTIVYVNGTLTISTKSTSSGGGGSSSSSTTTETDSTTTTNDDGSVTSSATTSTSTSGSAVTATVSDSNMETAIEAAVEAADGETATVEIAVDTKSSTDTISAVISADAATAVADSNVENLVVSSDIGTLEIPSEALAEIVSQAAGTDITVAVEHLAQSALTAVQQALVGDTTVVDLTITSGDETITSFGGHEITVEIPYALKDGESADKITVWHISETGTITPMDTIYNAETQKVSFKTAHFSVFAIIHDTNVFTDVDVNAYYYDAVQWAVANGVTSGTTDTTFDPANTCTRAQAVTFLWRAAGEPEATIDNPFTDVSDGAYYYDAVLWAVEMGITTGYDDGTFRPNATCNRGAIVTFLYRFAGEPEVTGEAMSDVADGAYYYNAVLWAVENGITTGYSDGTFQPTTLCNRGQIVTFLYRYLG